MTVKNKISSIAEITEWLRPNVIISSGNTEKHCHYNLYNKQIT